MIWLMHGLHLTADLRGCAADAAPLVAPQALRALCLQAVAAAARDEIRPIDDVRASAWYRRELVHNMTLRMLQDESQT